LGPRASVIPAPKGNTFRASARNVELKRHCGPATRVDPSRRQITAQFAAILVPMKPLLAKGGHAPEVVNRRYDAWWRSMSIKLPVSFDHCV
jgi:hypothetical protein